jgi:hypothetical protein
MSGQSLKKNGGGSFETDAVRQRNNMQGERLLILHLERDIANAIDLQLGTCIVRVNYYARTLVTRNKGGLL